MKINYCLPIIKNTKQEVLSMINNSESNYDYFEIWLDYMIDLDNEFVKKLLEDFQGKVILLFRRQNLEAIHMDLQKRKDIISALENTNSFLDLDISMQQEELDFIKENNINVKLITSYHNYDETPSSDTLQKTISEMDYYNPNIYKIATLCQTENDAVTLLQILLILKQQEKKYIVLGMGEKGSITRIFGTIWGNEMIFAPKEKYENSAPGQLTKEKLEKIFKILDASN
ncbi:MAG TPA: type I 3-dehydroquinate dehydratase [Candidatus Saccharimonadales bacterium]|nr:type I 3-dehydroquinate dehydratase [Candidatus Saccharimonadales bacterium]